MSWLFQSPWFTRLWVVQEISSSITPAKILCGNVELSWEHICLCADWFASRQDLVLENFPDFPVGISASIISMKALYLLDSDSVLHVLDLGSLHEATEERDYLYALLGHPVLKELASNISVDYEIPPQVLYKKVFHWFVAHGGNLDILSHARRVGHLEGDFASWAPQWHKRTYISDMVGYSGVDFSASATSHLAYSFPNLEELHTLFVDGFCFDTVSRVWDRPKLIGALGESPVNPLVGSWRPHPLLTLLLKQQDASTAYESRELSLQAVGATWVSGIVSTATAGSLGA